MELQNINKDEIEFFLKGESLGKSYLPESSTEEVRTNLARKLNIKEYDRFTFILNGIVRLDSDESPYFRKEIILYNPNGYIEDEEDYSDEEMFKYINWRNSLNPPIDNPNFNKFITDYRGHEIIMSKELYIIDKESYFNNEFITNNNVNNND